MSSIFISYSRKDLEIAEKIVSALAEAKFDTWIDWKSIPKGEKFEKEIYHGIETSNIFLFLISPESIKSEWCQKEIVHAANNNKRIIPIIIKDTDNASIPIGVSERNWVNCREYQDDFHIALQQIITTINTNYEWVKFHTKLQLRGLDWEGNKYKNGFLMHGEDLIESEKNFFSNKDTEPYHTELQKHYIKVSRVEEDKRKFRFRILAVGLGGIAICAFVATCLATISSSQVGIAKFGEQNANLTATAAQGIAEEEAIANATAQAQAATQVSANATAQTRMQQETVISRSQELASQSIRERNRAFDLSMLLSIEAFRVSDTTESRNALFDNTFTNPQLIQYLHKHTDTVNSVAFSPDGKILATTSSDTTIDLWGTESLQLISTLSDKNGQGKCLAFSPDGKILASDGYNSKIILWDVATKKPIGNLLNRYGGGSSKCSLSFSPDGKLIAMSGWHESFIYVWNVKTQSIVGKLTDNIDSFVGVAFSPDGKILASANGEAIGGDQSIILWNVGTFSIAGRLIGDPNFSFSSLAFNPDGKSLAAGGSAGVTIWSLDTLQPIKHLYSETFDIQPHVLSLAYNPDGTVLAAGGDDNNITIWDLSTENSFENIFSQTFFTGHTSSVLAIAFSPDGNTLVSGGDDHHIILWDATNKYLACSLLKGSYGKGLIGTFSNDASLYAIENSEDKKIRLCNISSGELIDIISEPSGFDLNTLSFSLDNRILVLGGCGQFGTQHGARACIRGDVILWDIVTNEPIGQPLMSHNGNITSIDFSPDGKTFAVGSHDNTITIWNLDDNQLITRLEDSDWISNIAISPNGKILASETWNTITLWDMSNHKILNKLQKESESIGGLVFSPDGKIIASANTENSIILWDTENRQPIGRELDMQPLSIQAIVFSPNGQLLAVSNWDGGISIWDVITQKPIGLPVYFSYFPVRSLVFELDGKTLVSGDSEGNVVLWDMDSNAWIEKACIRAGRNFTQAEWSQYFPYEEYRITCSQWSVGQ